jgi:hypothetical protein
MPLPSLRLQIGLCATVVHMPDQRLAPFALAQNALGLGLQHMDIERQIVRAAEFRQEREIILADTLRRRIGYRNAQSPVLGAVPGRVIPAIEIGHVRRGRARRAVHFGTDLGRQNLFEKRIFHILDQVLMIDRDRRAQT